MGYHDLVSAGNKKPMHFWRWMARPCGNQQWMLWRRRGSARDWVSRNWRYYARSKTRR